MGWKGTIRSINAASNRLARDAERRHKAQLKQLEAENTADAEAQWRAHLTEITSVHRERCDPVNWREVADQSVPPAPAPVDSATKRAEQALSAFKPSAIARVLGKVDSQKAALEAALENAGAADERATAEAKAEHNARALAVQQEKALAEAVLRLEGDALIDAIGRKQSLTGVALVGSNMKFSHDGEHLHAVVSVHDTDIVPDFRRKALASGKLSQTQMPKSEFHRYYQGHVASVAFRVAGEVFRIVPVEEVWVTCEANILNVATGHKEDTPILSVHFVRQTYESLNLALIDPAEALSNFNHTMRFTSTKGFSGIAPLVEVDVGSSS